MATAVLERSNVAAQDEDDERFAAHLRECLEEAGGNWDAATDLLVIRAVKIPEIVDVAVRHYVRDRIRGYIGDQRKRQRNNNGQDRGRAGMLSDAEERAAGWLDYPLSDGTELGDATADILDREIAFRQKLARTNAVESTWLLGIRKAMGSAASVRAALGESDVERLRNEAEKKWAK